jgi:hypothetical protein
MTPHCEGREANQLRRSERAGRKKTHPGTGRGNTVRSDEQVESQRVEDVLMNGDDLEGEDVLTAVVSDLEDGGLPGIVLLRLRVLGVFDVDEDVLSGEIVLLHLVASTTDFEGGHERSLRERTEKVSEEGDEKDVKEAHLSVGLKRTARSAVDVY